MSTMLVRRLLPGLEHTRLFHPLRDTYLRTCNRRYWRDCVEGPRRFYREFVGKGSCVFDIGANVGECARAFLSLGASRVVAVEPTPHLAEKLKYMGDKRLAVVPCAIDKQAGTVQFHVSNFDTLNSISKEWIGRVSDEVDGQFPKWIGTANVEARTLDSLIQEYGKPDFIKIDVEGHELETLQGLTEAPKYLGFEFHSVLIETALACLRQPCFSKTARFDYLIGEPYGQSVLALPKWATAEQMSEIARTKLATGRLYGDIFVRS